MPENRQKNQKIKKDVLFENLFSMINDIDISHHNQMTLDFYSEEEKKTSLNHTDNDIFEIFSKDNENIVIALLQLQWRRLEAVLNEERDSER